MSAAAGDEDAEVLVERRGRAGFLVLNRPKALNALTLVMVRAIAAALDAWERDPGVERVVLTAAGDKAFCAGGDIRRLYDQGRAGDHAAQLAFWREEYLLNHRIKRYPKPVVALIDGIVMGGGVGVSCHAAHRVTGERYAFAMPEVGIGFFPDVGATYLLPRLPRRIGLHLALTGARAGAGDALALGLAEAFVQSAAMPALAEALESAPTVEAAIAQARAPAPVSPLAAEVATIESCYDKPSLEVVLAALDVAANCGSTFAAKAAAAMRAKSPTSLAIAWRQMAIGAGLGFEEALRVEFRIVSRVCRGADFYEGVRAVIVDKDNRPIWRSLPQDAAQAARALDAYFAPLGADELAFFGGRA